MPDPSAGMPDGGWIVVALLSFLGLIGGGIAWLVGRKDRTEDRQDRTVTTREVKLDRWHDELTAREALFLAQQTAFQARIDRHLAEQDEKIAGLEGEVEKYRVSTSVLFVRLTHHAPDDPALKQVAQLLGAGVPFVPGDFDGEMTDLINRIG